MRACRVLVPLLAVLSGRAWGEPATLDARIREVVPTEDEDRFLAVTWRTNLTAARREAQDLGRPIFLWMMVGNPQGCT